MDSSRANERERMERKEHLKFVGFFLFLFLFYELCCFKGLGEGKWWRMV